jgi:hypothetical protein
VQQLGWLIVCLWFVDWRVVGKVGFKDAVVEASNGKCECTKNRCWFATLA